MISESSDKRDIPSDQELRRFDKTRKEKKVSNDDWVSRTTRTGTAKETDAH
jgi:hypothetical protein